MFSLKKKTRLRSSLILLCYLFFIAGSPFLVFKNEIRKFLRQKGPVEFSSSKLAWDLETSFTTHIPDEILNIFSGEFKYLGCGNQAVAFEDPSGTYVLKIFIQERFKRPKRVPRNVFREVFPFHRNARKQKQMRSLLRALKSYDLVFNNHPKLAALEAAHLSKCDCGISNITVVDPKGLYHSLDLNRLCFVVQKKAALVLETAAQKTPQERRDLLDAMEAFLIEKARLGYVDRETMLHMHMNYGFVDKTPVQIDVGRLVLDPQSGDFLSEEKRLTQMFSLFKKTHGLND